MQFGFGAIFAFSGKQRDELLGIIGITAEEGAVLLANAKGAIEFCRAEMSEELTPTEMIAQIRRLESLVSRALLAFPTHPEVEELLGGGLLFHALWPDQRRVSAATMMSHLAKIRQRCKSALWEINQIYGKPQQGRRSNPKMLRLALAVTSAWQDHWGEGAPRGKMLAVVEYLKGLAEVTGDAERALEILIPNAPRVRGRIRNRRKKPKKGDLAATHTDLREDLS